MTDRWQELARGRISTSPDVVFRDLGGEMVLLDLESGRYFGLDEVGTRFWSLLSEGTGLDEAGRRLLAEYAVDRATLQRDLVALIEDLEENGLVELGERS
jgi:hypothetical protein